MKKGFFETSFFKYKKYYQYLFLIPSWNGFNGFSEFKSFSHRGIILRAFHKCKQNLVICKCCILSKIKDE